MRDALKVEWIDVNKFNIDSGGKFLELLDEIGREDAEGLRKAAESYGNSWKQRGGVGAFMMLARKFDRMSNRVEKTGWDVFRAIAEDDRGEGVIDDVRDLRRYLMLVEAEMRARGFERTHRDNAPNVRPPELTKHVMQPERNNQPII